jgi:hypothetical protein
MLAIHTTCTVYKVVAVVHFLSHAVLEAKKRKGNQLDEPVKVSRFREGSTNIYQ